METGRNMDDFSSNYDNLLVLGDVNVEATEKPMKYFWLVYHTKNIIIISYW